MLFNPVQGTSCGWCPSCALLPRVYPSVGWYCLEGSFSNSHKDGTTQTKGSRARLCSTQPGIIRMTCCPVSCPATTAWGQQLCLSDLWQVNDGSGFTPASIPTHLPWPLTVDPITNFCPQKLERKVNSDQVGWGKDPHLEGFSVHLCTDLVWSDQCSDERRKAGCTRWPSYTAEPRGVWKPEAPGLAQPPNLHRPTMNADSSQVRITVRRKSTPSRRGLG